MYTQTHKHIFNFSGFSYTFSGGDFETEQPLARYSASRTPQPVIWEFQVVQISHVILYVHTDTQAYI